VTDSRRALLDVDNVSKHYEAVQALRDVSFTLRAGEVIGLIGDNGAGKSTLVGVISGTIKPDRGHIRIDGENKRLGSVADARAAGIETVFQNLALIPSLGIADNIFLGRERMRSGVLGLIRWTDKRAMRQEVRAGFERLGLRLPDPRTKAEGLSGGQRQAVAIARAVLWGSHIVVMDEPNAALGVTQTEIVLEFVEQLKQHDIGVIFISHNMEQVLRVADHVVVMRLGKKIYDGATAGLSPRDLAMLMTGAGEL
jgi:simple sugar transport system ATP-binding protein